MSPWWLVVGGGLFVLSQRQAVTDQVAEDAQRAAMRTLDRGPKTPPVWRAVVVTEPDAVTSKDRRLRRRYVR